MRHGYERFFGLAERPFSLTPDPSYLFESRGHSRVFSVLQCALRRRERFTLLTTGEVDVLFRNSTWTLTRDSAEVGVEFMPVNFYDGQGMMVRVDSGIETLEDMEGATVCVLGGTTTELNLTDAFCGFKAYRVSALRRLELTETGWGMPLQLWVQAAYRNWRIQEVGVPLVYLDPKRAFGGVLNNPEQRLQQYRQVIEDEIARQTVSRVICGACV